MSEYVDETEEDEVVVDREKRYGFLWLKSKRIRSVEWIKPENIRTWKIMDCSEESNMEGKMEKSPDYFQALGVAIAQQAKKITPPWPRGRRDYEH